MPLGGHLKFGGPLGELRLTPQLIGLRARGDLRQPFPLRLRLVAILRVLTHFHERGFAHLRIDVVEAGFGAIAFAFRYARFFDFGNPRRRGVHLLKRSGIGHSALHSNITRRVKPSVAGRHRLSVESVFVEIAD